MGTATYEDDVPALARSPRYQLSYLALKGRNMTAQGNALGSKERETQAL